MSERIYASNETGGEVYRLLNMVHQMAGMLANSPSKAFQLKETSTSERHVLTVWTNGIVDLRAESTKTGEGEHRLHEYWLLPVPKKCCEPTADEEVLLATGEYTPEELWGGNRPTCPKCIGDEQL